MGYRSYKIIFLAHVTFLVACALTSQQKLSQHAIQLGFKSLSIPVDTYTLQAYYSHSLSHSKSLNIYLDGDGIPWINGRVISHDPTPENPLILKLMASDPNPSVYLNRPCYGLAVVPKDCQPSLWTSSRYSQEVVNALDQALTSIKQTHQIEHFKLLGYSGGGSLAVLLAKERNDISAIITIAANLDHRSWTEENSYDALDQSLNPIDVFPLDKSVKRWHLVAGKDQIIDSSILTTAAKKDVGSQIIYYENFDHQCCWEKVWPQILELF